MIKILQIFLITVFVTSCNSKEKKTVARYQNQESTPLSRSVKSGKAIYNDMCITCHMANGQGVPRAFPPIANSDYLRTNQNQSIKAIKYGMSGEIVVNGITYNSAMAALGLSDKEVADVMNYINNSWGNSIDNFVTAQKVSKL